MEVLGKILPTTSYVTSARLMLWVFIAAAMGYVKVNASIGMTNGTNIAKPGCSSKCGNVIIPYPFGFGDQYCSLDHNYHVICNTSYDPYRPFISGYLPDESMEILSISETQFRIRNKVSNLCFNSSGGIIYAISNYTDSFVFPPESPFSFSPVSNRLTTVGCSVQGYLTTHFSQEDFGYTVCGPNCLDKQMVVGGQCDGAGCCQVPIIQGMRSVFYMVRSTQYESSYWPFDNCAYAFLAEEDTFTFGGKSDFSDPDFMNKVMDHVPVVIDWVIGNETCKESSDVCQANTACSNYTVSSFGGYICSCLPGYQGNPYLAPGCSDIDECAGMNNCSHICHNQPGKYSCSCPQGYVGDGIKNGTQCTENNLQTPPSNSRSHPAESALGVCLCLVLILGGLGMYLMNKKLEQRKLEVVLLRGNGSLLLEALLSLPNHEDMEQFQVFTIEEMTMATENFAEDKVLDRGGRNIVYKGVLSNDRIVVIKKSKVVDQIQIREFINQMVALRQINHNNNVVKIVGCCLETEVPMLVYDYISNDTLFYHLHNINDEQSWLDWSNSLRIAAEASGALAHLHAVMLIPFIRKVIKSSNILIDEAHSAYISDIGASPFVPLDLEQNQVPIVVQETLGYLDPEYIQSGHLTERSNVYSFGIVLIELLTRQMPISEERDANERTLSTYFVNLQPTYLVNEQLSGRLLEILDPLILEGAPPEQLLSLVNLILRCLSFNGEHRPTMMEVFIILEAMRNHVPYQ